TIMGVIMIGWCGLTLAVNGPKNAVPSVPDLNTHVNYSPYPPEVENPLGFIKHTGLADNLRGSRIEKVGEDEVNVVTKDGELTPMKVAPNVRVTLDGASVSFDQLERRRNLVQYDADSEGQITHIEATTKSD